MSDQGSRSTANKVGTIAGVILVIAVVIAAPFLFDAWLMPSKAPHFKNVNAIDAIIDSRLAIGLIRLVAAIAGLYLVVSIFARMRRGHWLSTVGPFKINEEVSNLTNEVTRLEGELSRAEVTIEELRETLSGALTLLESVYGEDDLGDTEGGEDDEQSLIDGSDPEASDHTGTAGAEERERGV